MLRLDKPGVFRPGEWVFANVVVALAYYLAARVEQLLPMAEGASTPVWPAAGVALAAALLRGRGIVPGLWLGALATSLWTNYRPDHAVLTTFVSVGTAGAAVLAALVAGWACRKVSRDGILLDGVSGVLGFFAAGGLCFAVINATIGTALLVVANLLPAKAFFPVWQTWWLGDAGGVLLVTPLLLAWLPVNREARPRRRLEAVVCFLLILATGLFVFGGDSLPLLRNLPKDESLALPFFTWVAFRLSLRTLTSALAAFATLAVVGTVLGHGPFQRSTPGDSLLVLDVALACLVCACLCLAALVREVRANLAALAASEEKFSKAFRSSPLAVAVTTADEGRFVDVNQAFLTMHGYRDRAEVIGRTSFELGMWTRPDDRAGLQQRLLAERRILNLKRPFRRLSGEAGTGLYSVEAIELEGRSCALLLVNDITERERAEVALRENELRLRLMAELIAGYSFAYTVGPDQSLRLDWLSEAGEKVLGFTEAELRGAVSFRGRIHPEDRAAQQAAQDAVLRGFPQVTEFRFRAKSGQWRWLQCFNRPEWDGDRVARITGAGQDITERRTSEQALRDSLEKTPNVCVQWYDVAGKILYWNHASQLTYGWTAAEALRRNLGELMFTPAQNEAFIGLLQDIQATGRTIGPLEFPFTRRDGRAGVCLSTLFAIPAPDGGSIYVCTDIDITDLKRAEEDRARLLAQLHFAEDAERRRIGRELHDSTAQQLAALKLNLVQMQKTLPAEASLADSIALTDQAIQEIRNFTWLLHPPLLDELGLARALADYGAGFARRSGVRTLVETGNFSGRLAPAIELALFRVAQESLTNILRHARSQTALIRLDRDEDEVRLEIQDTGCGMNADQTHAGVGIAGMRERLRLVGGVLEVESDAEGTTIFACVPLKTNSSLLTAYPT